MKYYKMENEKDKVIEGSKIKLKNRKMEGERE
jgi:hypothetical protein